MMSKNFKFSQVCLTVMLFTGSIATAGAAVTAQNIPGSKINVSNNANGSQTVNINAPSANGISHNKYSRFDVNENGLVLNNSKADSFTSVAGKVAGNRNLNKSGPARVILNEVTSSNASKLEGYLEVAGNKAHVIVANPNGITCHGCGFINTSRNTLTTGKPVFEGDELKGFSVEKGTITVDNWGWYGMMDNLSEYTDLIGRYVAINGNVHAKNLTVVAGRNDLVEITDTGVTTQSKIKDAQAENNVLIDVSALGGMYADKITLVANDAGVGVHNSGLIVANDTLNISAQGDISNNRYGQMISHGDIVLKSEDQIVNKKNAYINADASLSVEAKDLVNSSSIGGSNATVNINLEKTLRNDGGITGRNTTVNAGDLENNGTISAYGGFPYGQDLKNGNLTIKVDNHLVNKGNITGTRDLTISANDITNSGQLYSANKINAEAATSLTNEGIIASDRTMVLSAPVVNNSGKLKSFNSPYYESRIYTPSFRNSGELDGNFKLIDEVKPAGEIIYGTNPYDYDHDAFMNQFSQIFQFYRG
ncbi:Toxin CdiA [Mixta theicola]|nr:filamentous hemagglutinin N-terminal domain-containing protein [Mixta theicola]QHM74256.1 Toxin CdiA [Mixta theicola]